MPDNRTADDIITEKLVSDGEKYLKKLRNYCKCHSCSMKEEYDDFKVYDYPECDKRVFGICDYIAKYPEDINI